MQVLTGWIFSAVPGGNPVIDGIHIKGYVPITKGRYRPSAQLADKTKIFFCKKHHENPVIQNLMSKT